MRARNRVCDVCDVWVGWGSGHPCTLVTKESFSALSRLALSPGGVLIQNLFSPSPRVVRTMQEVFPALHLLDTSFSSKIIIGFTPSPPPTPDRTPPRGLAHLRGDVDVSHSDAVDRARFLHSINIGPRCYVHGLQHGQTDSIASMVERGHARASAPFLNAAVIHDSDPEVVALEQARWHTGKA